MSDKRFTFGAVSPNVAMIKDNGEPMNIGEVVDCLNEQQDIIKSKDSLLSILAKENEQLRMKLKGDDYIMVSEMLSNLRKTGICDGCKNKDKPVEWYLERGFSITGQICDRYEPED